MKEQIKKTAELIKELYDSKDGVVGGYGHIVFDDDNFQNNNIEWCIEEAKKGNYEYYSEETRLASLKALEAMLLLTEEQREKANNYYWNNLR